MAKSISKKVKSCRRNPLHDHPLLYKGGIHQKTNKAKRRNDKIRMKKECLPHNIFETVYFEEGISFIVYS